MTQSPTPTPRRMLDAQPGESSEDASVSAPSTAQVVVAPRRSAGAGAPASGRAGHRLTFGGVLHSEWIKLASLRSTWVTLICVPLVIAGFGSLASLTFRLGSGGPGAEATKITSDLTFSVSLVGSNFALLIVAVLGAVIGSREYSSGLIRLTMAAVPKRLPVLWAKLIMFFVLVAPVVAASLALSFTVTTRIIAHRGFPAMAWSDAGVVRVLAGYTAYLVGLGLIGVALGFLLRSLSGSIAVIIGGVLFLPQLASALLPQSWSHVLKYLPSQSVTSLTSLSSVPDTLSLWPGVSVFVGWVALAVVGAAIVLRSRDV